MPTYEYECAKCKSRTELVRSIKDNAPGPFCFADGCDGGEMDRLISNTSFSLKGSGWAKDGYSGGKS